MPNQSNKLPVPPSELSGEIADAMTDVYACVCICDMLAEKGTEEHAMHALMSKVLDGVYVTLERVSDSIQSARVEQWIAACADAEPGAKE